MTRSGRRPGNRDTAERIRSAALREFATSSYEGATIRRIADAAGVDPALVLHYFGSKRQLFDAALTPPIDIDRILERIVGPGPDGLANRLVCTLLDTWDNPGMRDGMVALLRSTASQSDIASRLATVVVSHIIGPVVDAAGTDHREQRAAFIASQVIGLIFARYIIGLPTLRDASHDQIVRMIGPAIERYLTMPLEPNEDGILS